MRNFTEVSAASDDKASPVQQLLLENLLGSETAARTNVCMMGPGVHELHESSHAAGGPRRDAVLAGTAARLSAPSVLEAGLPAAAQLPVSTPQQERGAAMLPGDSSLLRFRKVWGAQETGRPAAASPTAANVVAAGEARGNSSLAAVLHHQQLSCVGAVSSYSAGFSRLSASLSKAAPPAAASVTEDSQSVSPLARTSGLKLEGTDAVENKLSVAVCHPRSGSFHYKGTPSSGRLLPLGRLHAYDPTVEGRIEAFIAECCDAAGSSSGSGEEEAACVLAAAEQAFAAVSGGETETGAGPSEERRQQQRAEQRIQKQRQQLRMTAAIGGLTGKYTGWKVSLPVALPAMLEEQAEANVKFEEALGEACAVAAESSGGNGGNSGRRSAAGKEREKDGPRQSPVLQQLLQRLLEARRQAYELLPAKRVYEVVERRSSSARQVGQQSVQQMEEQDEEESGLGGARVLRYRLVDVSAAAMRQRRGTKAPPPSAAAAAAVGPLSTGEAEGDSEGAGHLGNQSKEPAFQDKHPAGAAVGSRAVSSEKKQKTRLHLGEDSRTKDQKEERRYDCSTEAFERRSKEEKQQHRYAIEVLERIPLGRRFIYRPKSDRHIRLAAESEVVSCAMLPPLCQRRCPQEHTQQQDCAQQQEQQASPDEGEWWQQHDALASQLRIEEGAVKQRWWAVHDVWELRPRRLQQTSASPQEQGLQQQESEQEDDMMRETDVEGPRWRLVVSEEGEIEDCSSDAVVLLLQRLARGSHKAAAALLKISASRTRHLSTRLGTAAPSEETLESAEDEDRYDETKRTSIQLVGCGVEMQQQRTRQEQLQKNLFGALALLLVENAQVLARWFDESLEGVARVLPAGTGVFYYPNHMGDAVQAVQRHYDQRKLISAGRSRVTGLRLHNNQVKRMLIRKYVERGQSVLELACGHGQDLWKYAERCISKFVGVDLSLSEIREARRRIREGHRSAQHMLQQMLCPPTFHVGNLVDTRALNFLKAEQFDIVSIQLSIHYMVETEKQARGVLTRAAAHLKEGGILLGSTVCCDAIASRLLQLRPLSPAALLRGEQLLEPGSAAAAEQGGARAAAAGKAEDGFEFGNDLYSVIFSRATLRKLIDGYPDVTIADVMKRLLPKQDDATAAGSERGSTLAGEGEGLPLFASVTSPAAQAAFVEYLRDRLFRDFGVAYHFFLADSIDATEFVLPWRSFCAIAASVGLKLVSSMTFPEFLKAGAADPRCSSDLNKWFSTLTPSKQLDKPQFEVFSLYKVFAFKKVSKATDAVSAALTHGMNSHAARSESYSIVGLTGRFAGGSIPHSAGGELATGRSVAATTNVGSLGNPSGRSGSGSGSCHDSSDSVRNSSGGSSNNHEEGSTEFAAERLAAREPITKSREESTAPRGTAVSSGEGSPVPDEEGVKQRSNKRFVEGVPLKRRKKRGPVTL